MHGMGISGMRGTSGGVLVLVPETVRWLHEAGLVRDDHCGDAGQLLFAEPGHEDTAYAVWTGIGAVGSVAVGILIFKEPVTAARMFFTVLLLTGIVGIKLTSSH